MYSIRILKSIQKLWWLIIIWTVREWVFFLTSRQSKANDNFSVRIQGMNQAFLHKCSQGSETPIPGRPRPAIKLSENSSPLKTCICHPRHPSPPSHLEKLLEQWSGNWTCGDSPGLWKAERAMDPDCSGLKTVLLRQRKQGTPALGLDLQPPVWEDRACICYL